MHMSKGLMKAYSLYNGVPNTSVLVAENVLDEFRSSVGKLHPETGGMLACSDDLNKIDAWCFDQNSVNTATSYSYDVDEMSKQFRQWKENGIRAVGFVHSHPSTYRQPSYDDIATARALMKCFKNDFFYLPIIISDSKGLFTMYFFAIKQVGLYLNVSLEYVQRATEYGYEMMPFRAWKKKYSIEEVEAYYNRINGDAEDNQITPVNNKVDTSEYFKRLDGVYPPKVLDKVVVCVGTGGARTILESMARNGFHNFVLIDGDKIAPSNIATQGVFISEMRMWKTEAIKARILDINPNAKVICVNKFLDDEFSDDEFEMYLKYFPDKEATDYLVLGCCDTFDGNKRSSELSLKYGLPYIGAGIYQLGLAAEVVFVYPGVTPSCPRCLLRSRYEAYEEGYKNSVTSVGCPSFATDRVNAIIGFISIMMLMYGEAPNSPYHKMLEEVKDRNFVWVRMSPYLSSSDLKIGLFDRIYSSPEVSKYTFFDETIWIPQHPDSPEYGEKTCKLCGGIGNLKKLKYKWDDTRKIG